MSGDRSADPKSPGKVISGGGVPQGGGGRPGWAGLRLAGVTVLVVSSLALFGVFGERDAAPNVPPPPASTTTAATASTSTSVTPMTAVADRGGVPVGYGIEVFLDGLSTPNGLAFDPSGGLFFSETGANRVSRVEILPDGSAGESVVVAASGIWDAELVALSDEGVLLVTSYDVVYRVADGVTTAFADGFNDAEGLAIGPNGDLYVADDRVANDADLGIRISKVEVFSDGTTGEVTEVVKVPGGCAADIEFGPTGELFVANAIDAVWVVEFAEDGSASSRRLATVPNGPRALAFDSSGRLFVGTSTGQASIWLIEPGESPMVFERGFSQVEDLVFDTSGSLYFSNVGTNQILRVTPSALSVGSLPVEAVRLQGGAFFERATIGDAEWRGFGLVVATETLVDGVFSAGGAWWDEGPVWWESGAVDEVWGGEQPRWIELDLGGSITVEAAIVQADGNDEYLLSYRDLVTGEWEPLWQVPHALFGGMQTRPNPADNTERMVFAESVTTNLLRFEARAGDGMYSVAEIQLFGISDSATTGTITLAVQDWSGVEGYRLLAVVGCGSGLGGGAFWTLIDSDPFSEEDVVHPPFDGEDPPGVEYESWGAGDYLWDETAQLEPGTCEVTFWANPGELAPYGSHIPGGSIERTCSVDVEVIAGEVSTVVITDIPVGSGRCPLAGS